MLPWKKTSGRLAYRRLSAYINVPEDLEGKEFTKIEVAETKSMRKYMTVGELAKRIGWTHEERI